jgi:hypothetical protein
MVSQGKTTPTQFFRILWKIWRSHIFLIFTEKYSELRIFIGRIKPWCCNIYFYSEFLSNKDNWKQFKKIFPLSWPLSKFTACSTLRQAKPSLSLSLFHAFLCSVEITLSALISLCRLKSKSILHLGNQDSLFRGLVLL